MRSFKSFYFNIYTVLKQPVGITFLALLVSVCLFLTSCNESVTKPHFIAESRNQTSEKLLNINTASVGELEQLPGIGEEFASRIIEHRGKYGKFQRLEDLILVRGMSDKKFRELRDLVKVE